MKKCLILSLLFSASSYAMHSIVDDIARNIVEEQEGIMVVKPAVAALLRNDGLFTENSNPISLNDAVQATQKTWFNKEWKHNPTEEDMQKSSRIAQGSALLSTLYNQEINGKQEADAIIAHAGVLPSVMKMFLAVKKASENTHARKLIVVLSNEQFNDATVQGTSLDQYNLASTLSGEGNAFPVVTAETKPLNQKSVVQLVHQGFANQLPNLTIEYVDKKNLPAFAQAVQEPTRVAVAASYPQLEAHVLTFASLAKDNKNWQVASGITAGPQPDLECLYDAEQPEAHYKFDRNNFARILHRLAEHYSKAQ